MPIQIIIIPIVIIVLVIIAVSFLPSWMSHITMTKRFSKKYGYSNFKKFKGHFEGYEWSNSESYRNSLWNRELDCELHANIIRFEGNGMIMRTPVDLWLVNSFIKKYVKNKYGEESKNIIKWC